MIRSFDYLTISPINDLTKSMSFNRPRVTGSMVKQIICKIGKTAVDLTQANLTLDNRDLFQILVEC
jgi:hypothetical protein